MKIASMKDVADLAGVSVATVSLALSGKGRISEKTRAKVRDAVEQLEYVVNRSARAMRTDRTGSVGLYLPDYAGTLDFYMALLFGVSEAAREHDYSVVMVAPNKVHTGISSIAVDGYILVDVDPDDEIARDILENPKPVIAGEAVDQSLSAPTASIEFDHAGCARALFDHLWNAGARNIAILGADANQHWALSVNHEYDRWAAERSMNPVFCGIDLSLSTTQITELIRALVVNNPEIDAVVAVPDSTAPAVVNGIRLAGKSVGEEILVASYFDGRFAGWMTPTITALDFRPRDFGRLLFSLFHEVVSGDGSFKVHQLLGADKAPLVIRESTAFMTAPNLGGFNS